MTAAQLRADDKILYRGTYEGLWFYLLKDGKFFIGRHPGDLQERDWHKNKGGPWIPRKRQNFVSLVKQYVREGDFDDLKSKREPGK